MGLFTGNQNTYVQYGQRRLLENTVKVSRINILAVTVLTLLNVVFLIGGEFNTYFPFSAYLPYALVDDGMFYSCMYPVEVYGEYLSEITFVGRDYFITQTCIAVAVLAVYVVCWIFMKKNPKVWMIVALVWFGIDTVLLLLWLGFSGGLLLDYLFHGWVIVYLAKGLSAIKKLKELPEEEEMPADVVDAAPAEEPVEEVPEEEKVPEDVTVEE